MNSIRLVMSVFLTAVFASALLGWRWVGVLPPAKSEAARIVLTLAGLAALLAMFVIWRAKPQKTS